MSKKYFEAMSALRPVILAGGSGTRLWPMSRKHYAKQYLTLNGKTTMLQATAERISALSSEAPACWAWPLAFCSTSSVADACGVLCAEPAIMAPFPQKQLVRRDEHPPNSHLYPPQIAQGGREMNPFTRRKRRNWCPCIWEMWSQLPFFTH